MVVVVLVANTFFLRSPLVWEQHWGQKRLQRNCIQNRPVLNEASINGSRSRLTQSFMRSTKNVTQSDQSGVNSRWHQKKKGMRKKTADIAPRHIGKKNYKSSTVQMYFRFKKKKSQFLYYFGINYYHFLLHCSLEAMLFWLLNPMKLKGVILVTLWSRAHMLAIVNIFRISIFLFLSPSVVCFQFYWLSGWLKDSVIDFQALPN